MHEETNDVGVSAVMVFAEPTYSELVGTVIMRVDTVLLLDLDVDVGGWRVAGQAASASAHWQRLAGALPTQFLTADNYLT